MRPVAQGAIGTPALERREGPAMKPTAKPTLRLATHDAERRGILIPASQLEGAGLVPGDRLSVKKGQRELFAVVLVQDAAGDILFDKSGIFVARTRRVDILLGGVFETFAVEVLPGTPLRLRIRPVGVELPLADIP
jgi:hypothetical protein